MNATGFNNSEQAALEALLNKKQMADMMNLYSNLVERCFMSCAKDMSSKTLSTKEEDCTRHCADKFFNMSSRVGLRFQEQNAEMIQKAQGQ